MNKLKEIFQQVNRQMSCPLALTDHEGNLIISSGAWQEKLHGKYYPIEAPQGDILKLYGTEALSKETLKLLTLVIEQHIKELAIAERGEILARLATGQQLLPGQLRTLLYTNGPFYLIWLHVKEKESLTEITQLLCQWLAESKHYTIAALDEGILLLAEATGDSNELLKTAELIRDTINSELYLDLYIAVSGRLTDINDLSNQFLSLKTILEIGKTFDEGRRIYFSEGLLLEKALLMIPREARKKILVEVFQKLGYDEMEDEMIQTARVFIDHNLSLADTARSLYIHRNTLVYRLDKIQKQTGIDLRNFKDAMLFKLFLLLKRSS